MRLFLSALFVRVNCIYTVFKSTENLSSINRGLVKLSHTYTETIGQNVESHYVFIWKDLQDKLSFQKKKSLEEYI